MSDSKNTAEQLTPTELAAKLNLETAKISWKELELFFAKGNLLVVQPSADLIKLGCAIHNDEKAAVENAVQQELIFYPSTDWVKRHCKPDTLFWGLVVAPFVLVQPIN